MDKENQKKHKEEIDMNTVLNKEAQRKGLLSDNPKFQKKVPRLNVVNGISQIDSNNPIHRKWFEEFKK
jgi:hypothetical protein